MAVVLGRDVELHAVAPVMFAEDRHDADIDSFEELTDVIALPIIFIEVHGQKLYGSIAGALTHAVQRPVDDYLPVRMDLDHLDGVRIGQLEVVVRMVADADVPLEVPVEKFEVMVHLLFVHQPVGVHDAHCERIDPVHALGELPDIVVAVGCDGNHVQAQEISFVHQFLTEFRGFAHVRPLEDDPYPVQERLVPGLDIVDRAGAVIDHGEDRRIARSGLRVGCLHGGSAGLYGTVHIGLPAVVQESYFYGIHSGAVESVEDIRQIAAAEVPIVDMSPVPESAVQEEDPVVHPFHLIGTLSVGRYNILITSAELFRTADTDEQDAGYIHPAMVWPGFCAGTSASQYFSSIHRKR